MYQERFWAFGFILPFQIIAVIDDTPRQNIDVSSDVMVVFIGFLGIDYLFRIVNWSTQTGNLCHSRFIYVVADYALGSVFTGAIMNNFIVIPVGGIKLVRI